MRKTHPQPSDYNKLKLAYERQQRHEAKLAHDVALAKVLAEPIPPNLVSTVPGMETTVFFDVGIGPGVFNNMSGDDIIIEDNGNLVFGVSGTLEMVMWSDTLGSTSKKHIWLVCGSHRFTFDSVQTHIAVLDVLAGQQLAVYATQYDNMQVAGVTVMMKQVQPAFKVAAKKMSTRAKSLQESKAAASSSSTPAIPTIPELPVLSTDILPDIKQDDLDNLGVTEPTYSNAVERGSKSLTPLADVLGRSDDGDPMRMAVYDSQTFTELLEQGFIRSCSAHICGCADHLGWSLGGLLEYDGRPLVRVRIGTGHKKLNLGAGYWWNVDGLPVAQSGIFARHFPIWSSARGLVGSGRTSLEVGGSLESSSDVMSFEMMSELVAHASTNQ